MNGIGLPNTSSMMVPQQMTPQFAAQSRPYVEFQRRAVERQYPRDHPMPGSLYTTDVDFVIVTPQGSKDRFEKDASEWFASMKAKVDMGMEQLNTYLTYQQQYEFWKQGKEIPLQGTPIADWPLATGEQKAKCLAAQIRTIEDLANCNQEALGRIGMGSQELRNRANSFLQAKNDIGPVIMRVQSQGVVIEEMAARIKLLEDENRALKMVKGLSSVQPGMTEVAMQAGLQPQVVQFTPTPEERDPNLIDKAMDDVLEEL